MSVSDYVWRWKWDTDTSVDWWPEMVSDDTLLQLSGKNLFPDPGLQSTLYTWHLAVVVQIKHWEIREIFLSNTGMI